MMKWIFASLILVNLTFLMWGLWYSGDDGSAKQRREDYRADKMRLLNEPNVVKRPRLPGTRPDIRKLKEVNLVGRCFRIGPFRSAKSTSKVTKQLKAMGITAKRRKVRVRITSYQIYLPPQKTKAAALRLQKTLYRYGFRDTFILTGPGLKNAVSLGVYTRKKNASKMIKRLRRKGFWPRQQVNALRRRVTWLDIRTVKLTLNELKKQAWGARGVTVHQMSDCNRR